MTSIPNTLIITLNTSIPGHQTIKFKPNMLIKNLSKENDKIYFNPLVPLNKSIINKIPENVRALEFFNKGLFESLINLHGVKKENLPTLEEARNRGIIDNNIKITLDILFPVGTKIYIDNNAYSIVDSLWSNGTWKLDAKPLDLISIIPQRFINPFAHNKYILEQFKEGKKELEKISETAKYGPNFDKTSEIEVKEQPKEEKPVLKQDLQVEQKPIKPIQPIKQVIQQPNKNIPLIENVPISKPMQLIENTPSSKKSVPLIEGPTKSTSDVVPESERVEEIIDQPMTINIDLPLSKTSSNFLRKYFLNNEYYFMVNQIYLNMNPKQKSIIQDIYLKTTGINIIPSALNLSRKAYDVSITGDNKVSKGLRVLHNDGQGNCFFISIADAINYYNYHSTKKIIYNTYGIGNNLFTQKFLRSLVANYVLNNLSDYISVANVFSENLNEIFKNQILLLSRTTNIDNKKYIEIVNSIYKNNDNLMVKKPIIMPTNNSLKFYSPFETFKMNEKNEIKEYFESSDYWADGNTIIILSNILKLNIIPIVNKNGLLSISNANLKISNFNKWDKYVFLYYNENIQHYELVSFDFVQTKVVKEKQIKVKKIVDRVIIFDNNNISKLILPPIYIMFLLFSTYYLSLDEKSRNEIILFKPYFDGLMNSFNNIINSTNNNAASIKFLSIFNKYFPNIYEKLKLQSKLNKNILLNEENQIDYEIDGGKRSLSKNRNPYNVYNPYNNIYNPYNNRNLAEQYGKTNESKLSYQINVDLLLQRGEKLNPELSENSGCIKKLNEIKKAYSNLTGQKYILPPVYSLLYNKLNNNTKKINKNNKNNKNKTFRKY